jgi:BirA family biotin operon repressor/biotin-[acetyl-CoA-carboxylase] ligase
MKPNIPIIWLDSVDSTNLYAINNFAGLPDGTAVAAHTQTAGRGRLGRKWLATPGQNICLSYVIKHPVEPFYHASAVVSLAALKTIRAELAVPGLWIKWPNDIYYKDKKIAGVLCEGKIQDGKIIGIVAGIGINVNTPQSALDLIDQPATSMAVIAAQNFNVTQVAELLVKALDECCQAWRNDPAVIFQDWKNENRLIGKTVEAEYQGSMVTGKITDINDDGSVTFTHGHHNYCLISGDIRIIKSSLANEAW